MQSMMITMNAKKLTAYQDGMSQKASGESYRYVCTAWGSRAKGGTGDTGVILYLEDYQKKNAGTRSGGEQEMRPERSDGHVPARPAKLPQKGGRLSVVLECISTAAIVAMAIGALICFFSL